MKHAHKQRQDRHRDIRTHKHEQQHAIVNSIHDAVCAAARLCVVRCSYRPLPSHLFHPHMGVVHALKRQPFSAIEYWITDMATDLLKVNHCRVMSNRNALQLLADDAFTSEHRVITDCGESHTGKKQQTQHSTQCRHVQSQRNSVGQLHKHRKR